MSQPRVRLIGDVRPDVGAVGVPVFTDHVAGLPDRDFLAFMGFEGQVGQAVAVPGGPGEPDRITVGCGQIGTVDTGALRGAAAVLARAAGRYRHVAIRLPVDGTGLDPAGAVRAVVEGFLLAQYRFTRYRTGAETSLVQRFDVIGPATEAAHRAVATARQRAVAVALARDLGNEPGGALTPPVFAERAAEVAERRGLGCEIWDEGKIAAEGLGGLLGVSRGSVQPPRLVVLSYEPEPAAGTIALVGKGITFDSGGLTVKPNQQMLDMKIDMAGAAAVLGAMSALRELGCPNRVLGWLPMADNMSGGDATRLGDVLRMRAGTTVEVRNADAEGRLILADALALAGERRPDAIVDVATLTAAVGLAVGREYAGLAGNHDGWVDRVRAAAERAGEPVWPLPLSGADRGRLASKVADLANVPDRKDGQSVAAALFLREFVPPDIPWAHLDIEGPAYRDADDGELVAGATGFGVRTLIELLTSDGELKGEVQ